MQLAFWIFHRPVLPTLMPFLLKPFLVRGFGAWLATGLVSHEVELNALDGGILLPLRCVGPLRLRLISDGHAVRPIRFVANSRYLFFKWNVHGSPLFPSP